MRRLVVAVCAYELVALCVDEVPTITAVCHRIRSHPVGSALIAGAVGFLWHHLLLEDAA